MYKIIQYEGCMAVTELNRAGRLDHETIQKKLSDYFTGREIASFPGGYEAGRYFDTHFGAAEIVDTYDFQDGVDCVGVVYHALFEGGTVKPVRVSTFNMQ